MIARVVLVVCLAWSHSALAAQTGIFDNPIQSMKERVEAGRRAYLRIQDLRRAVIETKNREALAELEEMSRRGNASAMVFMGCVHDMGLGGNKVDSYRAAEYFHAAASLNDGFGLYNLGVLYLAGRGIPANRETAKHLFTLAAKLNVKHAAVNLALIAEDEKKWDEAVRWYRAAAGDAKHDLATLKYGLFLIRGQGVTRNPRDGIMILRKASDTWNPDALLALAEIFTNGIGGQQPNQVEASKYIEILKRSPRPYDQRLFATVSAPLASISDIDYQASIRSAEIWIEAHPKPSRGPTSYTIPIWED